MRIVITAGPTREMIDPVRFLSNRSTGKMGYALAEAARDAHCEVTLISGPTALAKPDHINFISVISAQAMYDAVMQVVHDCDIFISVAAVSDYRPEKILQEKLKKTEDKLTLTLVRTPDILSAVSQLTSRPICIGFAAETDNVEHYARDKLKKKHLDMIIANRVSATDGFESDQNAASLISKDKTERFELMPKKTLAKKLIETILVRLV